MQKISSYLYSNRIQVNLDLATSPLEWRIVYQRKVKIYKGYDNVIELDIKNSEQKRINVSDKDLKCLIMDSLGQEIYTADVVHSSTPGLASFTVPADAVSYLTPQFLRYTVYVLNDDDTKNVIYGDTQFGVTGFMDLLGSADVLVPAPQIIKIFNPLMNTIDPITTYYSEAAEVNPKNDIDPATTIELEFKSLGLEAEVTVQVTYDPVISTGTTWKDLETFSIASSTSSVTKTYESITDFTDEVNWLRITYVRADENTGKFDRVLVRQ